MNSTAGAPRAYARIAGLMFLFVNVADLFGLLTTSRIRGSGFNPASVLFFYLFWKSRYIPRWLAAAGLVASAIALILTPPS